MIDDIGGETGCGIYHTMADGIADDLSIVHCP
jgi:hypothetical protein